MIGKNALSLIGNVGAVELRHTTTGIAQLRFTLAVGSKWKDKNSGAIKEKTQWFTCLLWGTRAEGIAQHVKKGNPLSVEGTHESRDYIDRDGIKRVVWEVNVSDLLLLPSARRSDEHTTAGDATVDEPDVTVTEEGFTGGDDDIPF